MSAERLGRTPEGLEWLTQKKAERVEIKNEQKNAIQPSVVAKKDLNTEYENLLKQTREMELSLLEERLKNPEKEIVKLRKKNTKSTQTGLSEGWTRATFIMREEHVDKLKKLASQHQTSIKDLMELAMMQFLSCK